MQNAREGRYRLLSRRDVLGAEGRRFGPRACQPVTRWGQQHLAPVAERLEL